MMMMMMMIVETLLIMTERPARLCKVEPDSSGALIQVGKACR